MNPLRLALTTALLLGGMMPAALAQDALQPCRVSGIKVAVRCGVLQRPLNPAQPAGVKIDIHYMVLPALARRKLPDPVFLLAGGPGQSAIAVAPMMTRLMARLGNRRDLVFVDLRGTGQSAPLQCAPDRAVSLALQIDPQRRETRLRQCLADLQKLPYGDLRFFTTPLAMQDVDAVRQALGAAQINLVGVSYGSRAALDYMRQFAPFVRRSVLDGVAPPDMRLPESVSADSQAVLDALLQDCENDAGCTRHYPGLRGQWHQLLASLPKTVSVADPASGISEQIWLTRQILLDAVRGPLYAPVLAAALPYAVQQAARGRFEALLGINTLMGSERNPGRLAEGLHLAVVCAEDLPQPAAPLQPPASSAAPGADFGEGFAQQYQQTCRYWPHGDVPAAFDTVAVSPAPVLLLSGGLDPVTPPRHATRIAQALGAKARHVVVPNAGHGILALGCMSDVLFRFIDAPLAADALAVDADCALAIPRPPAFVPTHSTPPQTP